MKKTLSISKIVLSLFLILCAFTMIACKNDNGGDGVEAETRVKSTLTNQQVLDKLSTAKNYYETHNHKTTANFNDETKLNILYSVEINSKATDSNTFVILSNSMAPTLNIGEKVVVEPSDVYSVGDIIKFSSSGLNMIYYHRIIGVKDNTYICHGDNTQYHYSKNNSWQEEADAIENKSLTDLQSEATTYQYVTLEQIDGLALNYMNYKSYITNELDSQVKPTLVENKYKYAINSNQKTNRQNLGADALNYALYGTTDNYMIDTFVSEITEQSEPQFLIEQIKNKNQYYLTALLSKESVGLGSETVYIICSFDDEKLLSLEKLTIQNEGKIIETRQTVKFDFNYSVNAGDLNIFNSFVNA